MEKKKALNGMDYIANVTELKYIKDKIKESYECFVIETILVGIIIDIGHNKEKLEELTEKAENLFLEIVGIATQNDFAYGEAKALIKESQDLEYAYLERIKKASLSA